MNAREIRGGDRSPSPLSIRPLATPQEAEACARIMAASEPWLTLRRSYEIALAILTEPGKEVHVAIDDRGLAGFLILDLRGPFTGYIQTVCVEPARRGCGVGTRLVQWAEERIGKESPNVGRRPRIANVRRWSGPLMVRARKESPHAGRDHQTVRGAG